MMLFKQFALGFVVKTLASFDDAFTRVPFIVAVTRTRIGKAAFAVGNLFAVVAVILLAAFFSPLIGHLPYSHFIISGLIFVLAAVVYFQLLPAFETRPRDRFITVFQRRGISLERFVWLATTGFIISFLTLIDDAVAFLPLYLTDRIGALAASLGIIISTLIQLVLVIFLAEQLERLKYQRQITTAGLLL